MDVQDRTVAFIIKIETMNIQALAVNEQQDFAGIVEVCSYYIFPNEMGRTPMDLRTIPTREPNDAIGKRRNVKAGRGPNPLFLKNFPPIINLAFQVAAGTM